MGGTGRRGRGQSPRGVTPGQGTEPRQVHARLRTRPQDGIGRDVSDRPHLVPDRLHQVRVRFRSRSGQGLRGIRGQPGRAGTGGSGGRLGSALRGADEEGHARGRSDRSGLVMDRVFAKAATFAAVTVLVLLAGVAAFLVVEGFPALTASASELPEGKTFLDYVAPLAFGTVLAAAIAALVAVPLAVAVALFITHVAPARIALTLGYLVDLLAAIPSIIYGLWGIFVLGPKMVPVMKWLEAKLGFIPIFNGPASVTGRTMLVGSLVLAVMILPIV